MSIEAEVDRLIDQRGGAEMLFSPLDTTAYEVAPGMYRSQGSTAAYVVNTSDGRVVINTGKGAEAAHHRRLFDAVAPGPTRYIITTQGHTDHVGGVAEFRDPGTIYVAHEANRSCQADNDRIEGVRTATTPIWFRRNLARHAELTAAEVRPSVQDHPTPDVTFSTSIDLRVGDTTFHVMATPGETVDSTVVWLPDERVCFTSNTFGPLFPHFPNLNTLRGDRPRQVLPWMESLRRVRELQPEVLITGRGEPIVGRELIDAALGRLHAAVDHVHTSTLEGMNSGVGLSTLMRTVSLPPHLRVGESYGKVSWAVRTIWESYTGWFKRASTTELYPDERVTALAEVVALAGVPAVLDLASTLIDDGRPVVAVHLLEGVLDGVDGPTTADPVARELMVRAHGAIRHASDGKNFWEQGWLDFQIQYWSEQ